MTDFRRLGICKSREGLNSRLTQVTQHLSLMDDDTEPPMDAGEPRLILSSHRALSDGLSGFVNPSDIAEQSARGSPRTHASKPLDGAAIDE